MQIVFCPKGVKERNDRINTTRTINATVNKR